jgi:hypothetical protein
MKHLDRRGAETDERSEFGEAFTLIFNKFLIIFSKKSRSELLLTSRNPVILSEARDLHHPVLCLVTFGDSPESTPPVQEGSLVFVAHTKHLFLLTKRHNLFLGSHL